MLNGDGWILLLVAIATTIISAGITSLAAQYARHRNIVDTPNHRSSHIHPTPRGGGVAIVFVTSMVIIVLMLAHLLNWQIGIGILLSSIAIAIVGGLDDLHNLSVRTRLSVQTLATFFLVSTSMVSDPAVSGLSNSNLVIAPLIIIAIVWLTNLYNFMDGIDGIAGIQALMAGITATVIFSILGDLGMALISVTLTGTALGFLTLNWSPSRIFMGDVGSGYLGFCFGALTLQGYRQSVETGLLLLFPLLPFVVDATVTLLIRLARGVNIASGHRDHVYQLAVRAGHSHAKVSVYTGMTSALLGILAISTIQLRWPPVLAFGVVCTFALLGHLTLRHRFKAFVELA